MLNSLTHTLVRSETQKYPPGGKHSGYGTDLDHGKACGSHATLSSEKGSINSSAQYTRVQFDYLEPLNNQFFAPAASLSASPAGQDN
jgi:hypothetical protein